MSANNTIDDSPYRADSSPAGLDGRLRSLKGAIRYVAIRALTLLAAVVTAVYLTILIVNLGGHVDTIVNAQIREQVGFMIAGGWLRELSSDDRAARAEETIAMMREDAGLNEPLAIRTARWLGDGLTLNWGQPAGRANYGVDAGAKDVRQIIVGNLSRTLLVFGVANVLMFGAALLLALALNRRYGGLLDRLFVLLSPLSAAPAWVFGILLSVLLLRLFGFTLGGSFNTWPDEIGLNSIGVTLRHLLLPFVAIFLAGLFQTAYTWRSYFLIHSNEEYVDLAYAKGLSKKQIDRRHILRPALPALLTSFALLLAVLWQDIIALEYFFNVQGIGALFVTAMRGYDTPMIVAITTTFAYLLVITIFVLDFAYVIVDPRVRLNRQHSEGELVEREKKPFWHRITKSGRPVPARFEPQDARPSMELPDLGAWVDQARSSLTRTAGEMRHYPAAVAGLVIIAVLVVVSVYTVIAHPYDKTVSQWRGDHGVWDRYPREALPSWVNVFLVKDLPPTISFSSAAGDGEQTASNWSDDLTDVTYSFAFDYDYGDFPQDIIVDINANFRDKGPHVTLTWVWPDGRELELTSYQPRAEDSYFASRDERLQRRLDSDTPQKTLFMDKTTDIDSPVPGTYTLRVNALHFEPESHLDVEVTLLGQVHGLAGTDAKRRDLMIPVLWGTPIALAFGLVAALVTSIGGMTIAALGAWHGGWIDRTIQFLTETNLILPFFPIALMVFTLYSRSIVMILGVTIALSLFGSAVKTFRATFLQMRELPYVQAARSYGASNWRIVSRYLMPRLISLLVPMMIILVPTYVFLEATLAFLGVSDPLLPTWGKLVAEALSVGIHGRSIHLIVAPFVLLFLTSFAFAMVGTALERILEPRLRES